MVGILALQGDVREHEEILRKLKVPYSLVKLPADLKKINRLIIPGGESTTIGKLLARFKLLQPIRNRIRKGMPVWGTCAGGILLAKRLADGLPRQPMLAVMNITARRNAFGRQLDSFEASVRMPSVSKKTVPVHFIRAPIFEKPRKSVEVLARLSDRRIIAARERNMLITSFHPELVGTTDLHRYFLTF